MYQYLDVIQELHNIEVGYTGFCLLFFFS